MKTADVFDGKRFWAVDNADARTWGDSLPKNSVHCVVTSPPYFGLRDYGHEGQIGLEQTPDEYVSQLVEVFRGVRGALHPSGTLWLNLGDSFNAAGRKGHGTRIGAKQGTNRASAAGADRTRPNVDELKEKDLIGIPWMVAFALRADGWYLRQWMPWVKRNPMPESADDRPGTACETVFLLAKSPDYFFDMEAVRKDAMPSSIARTQQATFSTQKGGPKDYGNGVNPNRSMRKTLENFAEDPGRNFRSGDLWFDSVGMLLSDDPDGTVLGLDVTTAPYKGSHFAVMPKKLILPMIRAGTSEHGVCPHCGEPWRRKVEKERVPTRSGEDSKVTGDSLTDGNRDPERHVTKTRTVGWERLCKCPDADPVPAIVADPFAGSGTVLAVARSLNRCAVGCELNPDYLPLIRQRVGAVVDPLF